MKTARDTLGVVVLESDKRLLSKFCQMAQQVWGACEVLPRQTGKELGLAALNLDVGLLIVRSSYQRFNTLIQNTITDMYADGTQIVIIQDGPSKIADKGWVSLAGLHFLSDHASDVEFSALLSLCLAKHCLPNIHKQV